MPTLSDTIRRLRSLLNEPAYPTAPASLGFTPANPGARFFTDTELTDWVNDGLRDIARRTEDLQNISTSLPIMSGVANYAVPTDLIRLHRVEFVPAGSTQLYPIEIRDRNTVDNLIGFNPQIQSSYPFVCWLWGTPNNVTYPLTISFYPVFSTGGVCSLWYFRLPIRLLDPVANPTAYTSPIDVVEGWDDLVVDYALTRAFQKAKNPEWQQRKADYENRLVDLIEVSRQWHDQANQIISGWERWGPGLISGLESEWY